MNLQFLERIFHFLAGVGWVMGMVWIGLCVFTVGMLILMYTRWGQSHPLEKCMGLSVLAHILLVGYATTISLTMPTPPPQRTGVSDRRRWKATPTRNDSHRFRRLRPANPRRKPTSLGKCRVTMSSFANPS